jgi:predicted DCC family thiol-disulfide oxidoreductase YuxK
MAQSIRGGFCGQRPNPGPMVPPGSAVTMLTSPFHERWSAAMTQDQPEPPKSSSASPIKVYYNSACPVCDAGIDQQRGRMAGCAVEWKDVHTDTVARRDIGAETPVELEKVREKLHAVDADGSVKVGVDAFALIWSRSPGEHWKARLITLPVVHALARLGYAVVARLLYRWNRRRRHW